VHCFAPDGTLLGKILLPEMAANVCFGGASLNRLFIAGTTSIYSVHLAVNGLPVP
jgi:gluconolactonase